ncbi:MAG: hypothetical protein Q4B26_12355 [Eubacteriales bacterium]|nr:hypothetical protein [Eubacteriales bacterium]
MKLNRKDLRKIANDYNSLCNRLLQADFNDYNVVLARFIDYLNRTEIIKDYIVSCGECNQNMEAEFNEVQTRHAIFDLGSTDEEEVRNVFAILTYIVENNINVYYGVAMSYSSSRKYQEILKDFNDRVTMVLIRHIENYLRNLGIDMGLDEKMEYVITMENGQINIASDSAVINATNNVSNMDQGTLDKLISRVREEAKKSSIIEKEQDMEVLSDSLETIQEEASSDKPRKGIIRTAIAGLTALKGSAEFGAAVVTLVQFIQPLLK